jgi:hypothetical protein
MKNDYLKYFKPNVLVGLIVFTTTGLLAIKIHWGIPVATVAMNMIILKIISTRLWSKKWINWMFWVDDLSGRYEGTIEHQYIVDGKTKSGSRKHIKILAQNGFQLKVTSFTLAEDGSQSSPSTNIGMHVQKTQDDKHFELIYNYLNSGNTLRGFQPHYGTDYLKIITDQKGEQRFSGNYFTDRNPQTRGVYIDMKKVSNDLFHEF